MGSSGSCSEIDDHLKKWESAVSDINSICQRNRKTLENPETSHSEPIDERLRTTSLVSFRSIPKTLDNDSFDSDGKFAKRCFELKKDIQEEARRKSPTEKKPNRQHIMEVHRKRISCFKSYVDVDLCDLVGRLACDHFATVAVALSCLLGGLYTSVDRKERVTVEDIFFAAHVPLHLLNREHMTLTELYDVVHEFLDVDNRFKGEYRVEVVHLDVAPIVGQVELGSNECGDRQTKIQLPEFRKTIQHDLDEEPNSIMIANFDPFVLEQDYMMDDEDEDEDYEDYENDLSRSLSGQAALQIVKHIHEPKKSLHSKNNGGMFAAITECRNAVQFMVTLAKAATTDRLHCELEEVPLNSLFKAMTCHQPGERARGYLRISKINVGSTSMSGNINTNLGDQSFFSPELCSGKVVGSLCYGIHAHSVVPIVSPHLVAFAWALHLINGASENSHHHGRGLPIGDIIRKTNLPCEVYLECDIPLEQVYLYAKAYLSCTSQLDKFRLEMVPVLTRVSRDDAVPTMSVFDLESVLMDFKNANQDPESPSSIMIIQYNANVAHNVLGISSSSQWCILAGYDSDTQTVTLIDANANKFCASWTCPLDRIHKAITTHGYLSLTKVEAESISGPNNSTSKIPAVVQSRTEYIKSISHMDHIHAFKSFPFPKEPFAITVLAMALSRIGIDTDFDHILTTLPYQPSAILDFRFGIEALMICARDLLKSIKMNTHYTIEQLHFDMTEDGENKIQKDDFEWKIKEAISKPDDVSLIVHYNQKHVDILGTMKPFGEYGLVTGYKQSEEIVIVTDCNPSRYSRSWEVSLSQLHTAIASIGHHGRRSRGIVTITKHKDPIILKTPQYVRKFDLQVVPMQNTFQMSPSPQIQALSVAFAQLGHYNSPEEIFYEAYLKTVNDQRRRGSQAFAWRDVEVSLAILNQKIDKKIMTLVARKFIESRKISNLSLELLEEVEIPDLPDMLIDCCKPSANHVIMLNYDAGKHHEIPGMGSSVALIQSYDEDMDEIGMFDCEYCLYGLQWKCTFQQLIAAADLENPGTSKFGFVKLILNNEKNTGIHNVINRNMEKRDRQTKFID
eukprot:Tbor_TRINITY_DN9116_c0_g1::TRINITY_DN9116_c0_g1_i1::g.14475::m.14475